MKKGIRLFLFVVACMFLLTACKKEKETLMEEPSEMIETESYKYGFSCLAMDNPYYIELEHSLRKHVEAQGNVLITKDAKSDADQQNRQIEELIEEGIDAIFLTPVDWTLIEPALDKLNEAEIKIINLDTQVQAFDKVDAYVGSDNENAGKLCGEDLLERLPQGGKIIIVECPNRNSVSERIKGFEKTIAKQGFEVVARIDAKGQLDVALPEVEEALRNNPDVVAIMCGDDPTALGALVAAKSVGAGNLVIYGIDGSPEVKKEMAKENSQIVATVAQSTEMIGQEAAAVALQMMNDERYEDDTYIDTYLITKENIAEYSTDAWQ